MKTQRKLNKKKAFNILKEIFKDKKGKVSTVSLQDISLRLSKKHLLTADEIKEDLTLLADLNYIDMLAKSSKKEYSYTIKLKIKGENFLRRKSNKFADFFIGVFVYLSFIALLTVLIIALRRLFTT